MDFTIKQHDTLPPIQAQLTDSGDYPYDLRYADVRFRMVKRGASLAKVGAFAEVLDEAGARVRYVWQSADTDTVGVYRAEFEVTDSLGRQQTYPKADYLLVEVVADLFTYSSVLEEPTPPDEPPPESSTPTVTGLIATPGDAHVNLTWNAVAGVGPTYTVKRSEITGGPYSDVSTGISGEAFDDTFLQNGTTYFYVVSATIDGVEGADSSQVSATPNP